LSSAALKLVIEFIYTGQATFDGQSTAIVIEVADAAYEIGFTSLVQACGAELWKRVAEKPSADAFNIVLFANSHQEMNDLKQRCFDVLAENYEKLGVDFADFGGDSVLKAEMNRYVSRRVGPSGI